MVGLVLRAWLAFASPLRGDTFYDERFSFRNVRSLVAGASLRPENAYYGSLSYLPHAALLAASEGLHRATGAGVLSIYDPARGDGFSSTAYALARSVSVVAGTTSLWLLFVLGRRLFGVRAGLLAAAILAAAPNHVLNSAHFKPDILVDLFALGTFLWSLDAVLGARLGRYLVAGCGVGLAAASKYNGAAVALPLALGTLAGGWDRKRWGGLLLAGLASVGVFVLLNPFLGQVADYFGRQMTMYGQKGEAEGLTRWQVVVESVRYVAVNLRWPLMLLAGLGTLRLAARTLRPATARNRRLEAVMLLGMVIGFPMLYALSTSLFRGQNILPVVGFAAVLASWSAVALWDRAAGALWAAPGSWARRAVGAVLAGILVGALFVPTVRVIYLRVVPTTSERAERMLTARLDPIHLRTVVYEAAPRTGERWGPPPLRPGREGHHAASMGVDRLSVLAPEVLERADAEVFLAERALGAGQAFYLHRLAAGRTLRIAAEPFVLRGPDLAVVLHPWRPVGEPRPLRLERVGGPRRFRGVIEGGSRPGSAAAFSLSLWLPRTPGRALPRSVRIDGREAALTPTDVTPDRVRLLSARLPGAAPAESLLELVGGEMPLESGEVDAEIYLWLAPLPGSEPSGNGSRRRGRDPG